MHEDDCVETSDAEEREGLRALSDVYWEHDDPTTCNAYSSWKQMNSRLHTSPCKLTPSKLQLAEVTISPYLLFGTPQSSSPVSTPVPSVPDSRCEIWQESREGFDGSACGDSLSAGVKDRPDLDIPDICCSAEGSMEPQHSSTADNNEPSILSLCRERSQSIDPLYLFSSPHQSRDDARLPQNVDPTNDTVMSTKEAHLVSPHHLPPSSPFLSSFPSPTALTTVASDATPPHSSGITYQDAADEPMDFLELNVIPDKSRYQLRHRGANQLKPYTVEQFQYKQALRANPDAIVKFHGGRRRYSDEEDDNIWKLREHYADDSGNWEESGRKRAKISHDNRSKSGQTVARDGALVQYPDILQDLSSTDEEEAKGFQALSKEARKMERERRANDKLNRKHRTKPRLSDGRSAGGMARGFDSSQPHPDGSDHLHSLQDKPSSPSPMGTRGWRSTAPVLTSYPSATSGGTYEEHTNTPDIERLESHRDMDVDGSGSPGGDDVYTYSVMGGSDPVTMMDRKGWKALNRVMPKFMVNRILHGDDGAQRSQGRHSLSPDSDEAETALLPGKTRTRRAEKFKVPGEIKGDSESSSDERSSASESLPEDMTLRTLSGLRPHKHRNEHIIEVTDTSDDGESSNSDDGVDDEEIQIFLKRDKQQTSNGRLASVRDESLVDWMLARTRTVGVPKRPSVKKRSLARGRRKARGTSRYKFDIHALGSRKADSERQLTLNFPRLSNENSFPKGDGTQSSRTFVPSTSSARLAGNGPSSHMMRDYDVLKKRTRRLREKESRQRAKNNGLYIFPSDDLHVVTGRRGIAMVTLNLEDEDFHMALVPSPQNRVESLPSASCNTRTPGSHTLRLSKQLDTSSTKHPTVQRTPKEKSGVRRDIYDSDIPVFHSGLSFGPDTFTGRGWLHGLIREISSPADVPEPVTFTLRGSELGPTTDAEKLCYSLKNLTNYLFDLVCDLPELDREQEDTGIGVGVHLLCKLLSWFLATCNLEDRNFVLSAVEKQVSESLVRLREISNSNTPTDRFTFSICWLMVEISARLGYSISSKRLNPLKESVSLLVHNLFEYGLPQTMVSFQGDNVLEVSTTARYTAELWVCLFHLLDHYQGRNNEKPGGHLFWAVITDSPQFKELPNPSLERNEVIWRTIFSLCALAQFSIHGMTTATSRLPACWEFVVLALRMIRLSADPAIDRDLSALSLDKRDAYLHLITLRCFHLWHRWRWSLDGASTLFNHLVDIFRSRKFAKLRHETADYPAFMLTGDWGLLSSHRCDDTAFILFLKLMYHATNNDKTNPDRGISPKGKKLLSLAMPVGALPFSKGSHTQMHDLSMIFNRLTAVAIGIYLDPGNHISRIAHARTYVNFSDADETTRLAVMRGMMYLGILLKNCNVPLDGIADWTKEMADALADEFKAIPKTIAPAESHLHDQKCRVMVLITILLRAVRRIVEAYKDTAQYPEPGLLASCRRILLNTSLTDVDVTAQEILRLAENFLNARAAIIPPPARPPLAPLNVQESQESQDDYGGIDLDFDDPALRAALGDDVQLMATRDFRSKEEALKKAIETTQLTWLCWRFLNKRVLDPSRVSSMDDFKEIESWLDCWLGCVDVLIRYGGKSWEQFLKLIRDSWGTRPDDVCRRRIDLSLWWRILKLDPMTYTVYTDRYIEVMVEALVSSQSMVENEFISLLLSIDGLRHPLLKGVSCDMESGNIDDRSLTANFPELRLRVLKTFIANIALSLREEVANPLLAEDNIKYVGFCIKMLSTMRSICTELGTESEGYRRYIQRCQRILEMINQYPEIGLQARLDFLIDWGNSLS